MLLGLCRSLYEWLVPKLVNCSGICDFPLLQSFPRIFSTLLFLRLF